MIRHFIRCLSSAFAPRRASVRTVLLSILVLATLVPSTAPAAEVEEIPFPERVQAGALTLPLHGLGLLRYRVFFRGYVGGLYLPQDVPGDQVLSDVPKAMELYYFWDIDGALFGEAADDLLARAHPPERVARLRSRLDRLHALYKDVKVGDRYRLTYVPGTGTTLSHNGQDLGTIPGADFAQDYFGIWLGDEPLNETFRDQMIRGR